MEEDRMPLKPHTWYWFWCRPDHGEDGRYIEGVTELHELPAPNMNYCSCIRTDADGNVIIFSSGGEWFEFKDE
jgi:hypothetical protein